MKLPGMLLHSVVSRDPHIIELKNVVDHDTVPHAMMFWGREGSGKLATAIAFMKYLFCEDRQPEGSCGVCAGCVKTEKLMHPDVHFLFPRIGAKENTLADFMADWRSMIAENPYFNLYDWMLEIADEKKQPAIYESDISALIERMQLQSYEGGMKMAVIWMADLLGNNGNRLLKMIEEPPDGAVIVMISEDPNRVLPTIISRCRQFYFRPLGAEQIVSYLEHKANVDTRQAASIANNSHGNLNLAIKMLMKTNFYPVEWLKSWLEAIWKKDYEDLQVWVSKTAVESKNLQKEYFAYLLDILQKVFWLKWGFDFDTDNAELDIVKWLNRKIEFNELESLKRVAERGITAIERNANPRITWMDASIQLRNALMSKHAELRA